MKETLSQLGSPIVLCHNDLLCKNIIYDGTRGSWQRLRTPAGGLCPSPTSRGGGAAARSPSPLTTPAFASAEHVRFIDYEYTGYNYQAFDIGNHFNEFAGELGSSPWHRGTPAPPPQSQWLPRGLPVPGDGGGSHIPGLMVGIGAAPPRAAWG